MSDRYILRDGEPVAEPDLMVWRRWFEENTAARVVAFYGEIGRGNVRVSTVFLGLDHGWNGEVLLFETLVFGGGRSKANSAAMEPVLMPWPAMRRWSSACAGPRAKPGAATMSFSPPLPPQKPQPTRRRHPWKPPRCAKPSPRPMPPESP